LTIHENVKSSVDLFLRGNFAISQIRYFSSVEKIGIKSRKFPSSRSKPAFTNSLSFGNKNWISMNQVKDEKFLKLNSKKLVIYPYSFSNNLLKEVFLKMKFKFVLTNEIRKASLIIGLKKHLKQNFKLTNFARQKNIPIYSLNQVSFYQVTKLIQFLSSYNL